MDRIEIPVGEFMFDAWAAGPSDGTPVLFLHGFPQSGYEWRYQLAALSDAGYRAVAPDQRGYSPRARPPDVDDYRMHHLVGDVIAMADVLGFECFHLVGHDWGAAVAWAVGASNPDRLVTLTPLSVPHPQAFARALGGEGGSDQSKRSSYFELFRSDNAENVFLQNDAQVLRGVYASMSDEDVDVYVSALSQPGALTAGFNWYRAMYLGDGGGVPGLSSFASEIVVPTMFVWSTEDAALGREGAELTAQYVKGPYRFEILEGISHWIPEEAPDDLNRLLLDHLGSA